MSTSPCTHIFLGSGSCTLHMGHLLWPSFSIQQATPQTHTHTKTTTTHKQTNTHTKKNPQIPRPLIPNSSESQRSAVILLPPNESWSFFQLLCFLSLTLPHSHHQIMSNFHRLVLSNVGQYCMGTLSPFMSIVFWQPDLIDHLMFIKWWPSA